LKVLRMLSLSQTTGYAILALSCIGSWKGDWVLSKTIHECTGVPMPYLRKILFQLSKTGLIQTKRGYQGGFCLERAPEEISLLEVVRAVEPERASDCLLGLAGCSDATPCPLRSFWKKERVRIEAELKRLTVAEAARAVRAARWGKLTACPPPDYVPKRARGKRPARASRRKGASGSPKRGQARRGGRACPPCG
jgi:Rrf2 family iron-sulfur cluster assembly transcriptional regulator